MKRLFMCKCRVDAMKWTSIPYVENNAVKLELTSLLHRPSSLNEWVRHIVPLFPHEADPPLHNQNDPHLLPAIVIPPWGANRKHLKLEELVMEKHRTPSCLLKRPTTPPTISPVQSLAHTKCACLLSLFYRHIMPGCLQNQLYCWSIERRNQ